MAVVVVPGVLTEMGIENGTLNILPLLGSLPTWHSWSRWIDTVRSSIIEHEQRDWEDGLGALHETRRWSHPNNGLLASASFWLALDTERIRQTRSSVKSGKSKHGFKVSNADPDKGCEKLIPSKVKRISWLLGQTNLNSEESMDHEWGEAWWWGGYLPPPPSQRKQQFLSD